MEKQIYGVIYYFRNKINSSNLLGNRAEFLEQQMERLERNLKTIEIWLI